MYTPLSLLSVCLCSITATSFAFQQSHLLPLSIPIRSKLFFHDTKLHYSSLASKIDISETSTRDMSSLFDWASNYGVQMSDCIQFTADDEGEGDGLNNVYVITNQDLPQETPILCVPNELILTGNKAREEFGDEANAAEQVLNSYGQDQIIKFYLFLKILKEYELGEESPYFYWLNSLPRYFSNGASMSDFCYGCLPPFAASLAQQEKKRMKAFFKVLRRIPSLSSETKNYEDLTKWAFAVVNTRSFEIPMNGDFCIVPMGDYVNHGGYDEINVERSFDDEGNFYFYSTQNIPAGSPLKISYGDSTNPSKLLAQYGFLDDTSPATYCKYIIENPSPEVINMGYPSQMLFYNDGGISDSVWNIILYEQLKVDPQQQQAFYQACMIGDEATRQSYHQEYFVYTFQELQKHVDYLMNELEELVSFDYSDSTCYSQEKELDVILCI